MMRDCKKRARRCKECVKFNVGVRGFHPLRPIKAMIPMDFVMWDFAGPFKGNEEGYVYVLVVVDVASGYVWLRPMMSKRKGMRISGNETILIDGGPKSSTLKTSQTARLTDVWNSADASSTHGNISNGNTTFLT